jgi:UDP-N-acetylglucosamine 4,6-dehydratase
VRYGNVVGSKGSVVPLFLRQREAGELTITDPTMTRFWIGMDQAVDLVLLALLEGRGGEVFVPRIPACTLAVLAEAIAPGARHKILNMRPGEKLHETLITEDESHAVVEYDRFFVIQPNFPWWGDRRRADATPMERGLRYASNNAEQYDVAQMRGLLSALGFPV